jgi:hypothetical protein
MENRPFPKAEALEEKRRQNRKENAVLADAPVNVALEAEGGARAKPVKCNRLFSGSQEKSRKRKQLEENV